MKRVLIVEDEYGTAQALALLLECEGYEVDVAANGRAALERIAAVRPDVVVTDFMMPVMDGARLGRSIRADVRLAELPLIVTTSAEEARVRESFDAYDAYLRKPFGAAQLLTLVRTLAEQGQARREAEPPPAAADRGPLPDR